MSHKLALQEITRMTNAFKAFENAKNILESLASVEQNVKELEAERMSIINLLTEEKTKLSAFRTDTETQKKQLMEQYKKDIERTRKKYNSETVALEDKFFKLKQEQETIISELAGKAVFENEVLKGIQKEIKDKEVELANLENKVQEVKKQITKLLG